MKKQLLFLPLLPLALSGCGLFDPYPRSEEFYLKVINKTGNPNSFGECQSLMVGVSNSNKPDLVIKKSEVTGEQVFTIPFIDNHSTRVNERLHTISVACENGEKQVFSFKIYERRGSTLYHKSTVPSWLSYVGSVGHVGTLAEAQAGSFILIKQP